MTSSIQEYATAAVRIHFVSFFCCVTFGPQLLGVFLEDFLNQRQAQRIGLVDFVGDVETVGCCVNGWNLQDGRGM